MCLYCYAGDHFFRWDPVPWKPNDFPPYTPIPGPTYPGPPTTQPYTPPLDPNWRLKLPEPTDWNLDRLKESLELLKQIKALEDQLGCPCEPSKENDYIDLFKKRIAYLEEQVKQKRDDNQENT